MAKVVVIGIAGESGLWLADLDAGTVTPIKDAPSGDLGAAVALSKQGITVTKGVSLAVTASSAAQVAAGLHVS